MSAREPVGDFAAFVEHAIGPTLVRRAGRDAQRAFAEEQRAAAEDEAVADVLDRLALDDGPRPEQREAGR